MKNLFCATLAIVAIILVSACASQPHRKVAEATESNFSNTSVGVALDIRSGKSSDRVARARNYDGPGAIRSLARYRGLLADDQYRCAKALITKISSSEERLRDLGNYTQFNFGFKYQKNDKTGRKLKLTNLQIESSTEPGSMETLCRQYSIPTMGHRVPLKDYEDLLLRRLRKTG